MPLDLTELGPEILSPARRASSTAKGPHFVHLYDDGPELIEGITRFLSVGFLQGEAAIALGTEEHLIALVESLEEIGHDVAELTRSHRLQSVDADEVLRQVMVDGVPKRASFSAAVGRLIERAAEDGRKVRVFGELVTLLMERGNVAGAIRLEELWNDQADTHAFQLYCGYPSALFSEDNLLQLKEVCRQHTHIILQNA